jgi:hypothetical protein
MVRLSPATPPDRANSICHFSRTLCWDAVVDVAVERGGVVLWDIEVAALVGKIALAVKLGLIVTVEAGLVAMPGVGDKSSAPETMVQPVTAENIRMIVTKTNLRISTVPPITVEK